MKVKCDYCGSFIEDTDETCPNCGAVNSHLMRSADGVPKTIEELKAFAKAKNLPLEEMRFFIGIDYKEPKAFGIYEDSDGNFIVYKNKGDGTRAERYRGKDEAYAVNEIYQKMKTEVQIRREKNGASRTAASKKEETEFGAFLYYLKKLLKPLIPAIILVVVGVICLCISNKMPDKGYYNYNGSYYYCLGSDWYRYGDGYWYSTSVDDELSRNYSSYYDGTEYENGYGYTDFEDTDYYSSYMESSSSYNDDWDGDNGGDWDYGGNWDAGDTNWDTDW